MILGTGIDIVRVKRFENWDKQKLSRIFSIDELEECRLDQVCDLSRIGARFAAKEALFKALSATLVKLGITEKEFSLLFLCKHAEINKSKWGVPVLKINWKALEEKIESRLPELQVDVSISHESDCAIAHVVIQSAPSP